MLPVRIAVVDLGSNSLKLSVTEVGEDGAHGVVHAVAVTVRLGLGVKTTGMMEPERVEAAITALRDYETTATHLGATVFIGVATAAVRIARNGPEFLSRVAAETSWKVRVISGDEEADLAFEGLKGELPDTGSQVILDIGGASTEIIHVVDRTVLSSRSVQIGSGTLADQCLVTDPPGLAAVRSARDQAAEVFAGLALPEQPGSSMYVTGGNGMFLSQVATWDVVRLPFVVPFFPMLVERLAEIPSEQVANHLEISAERARILPAGGAIVWSLIDRIQPSDMHAVQSGIRAGLIQRWIAGSHSDPEPVSTG